MDARKHLLPRSVIWGSGPCLVLISFEVHAVNVLIGACKWLEASKRGQTRARKCCGSFLTSPLLSGG